MNEAKVRQYLAVIKKATQLIEDALGDSPTTVGENAVPIVALDKAINTPRQTQIDSLIANVDWPETVPQFQLKEPSDDDQRKRAKAVMDMVLTRSLTGLDFLDFGCGDGWLAEEALRRGARLADGYDTQVSSKWTELKAKSPALSFTSVFHEVDAMYDVIMLYDVLDHCYDPIDVMSKVKSLLKPDGIVYVRCHPWTSKHATHVFKQGINKAYFHLFLSWDEMNNQLGRAPIFTRPEIDPVTAYRYWFQQFRVTKENIITEPVSDFFQNAATKKLIQEAQKLPSREINTFMKRMEIQFVDYRLEF